MMMRIPLVCAFDWNPLKGIAFFWRYISSLFRSFSELILLFLPLDILSYHGIINTGSADEKKTLAQND
jgi:hypothetical protein